MPKRMADLFNVAALQKLFESYFLATGVSPSIVSLDEEIIVGSRWQTICIDLHRRIPEAKKWCIRTNPNIHKDLMHGSDQPFYNCPTGFIEAAIPLVVKGQHVANLLAGQFRIAAPDAAGLEVLKKRARGWDFDEDAYLAALQAVPIVSGKKIGRIMHFLKQIVEMSRIAGGNHPYHKKSRHGIDDNNASIEDEVTRLEITNQKLAQLLDGTPIPTFVVGADSNITHWNRACEILTDISAKTIIGTDLHRTAFYRENRELMADLIVRNASRDELDSLYGDKYRTSDLMNGGYQGEDFFPKLGEHGKWLFFTCAPLKDTRGKVLGAIETLQDITSQKDMIQALQDQKTELDEKGHYLEKANQALKALLDHREVERRAVEENLQINLKRFVLPYVEELEKCKIGNDGKAYANIIRTNINDILSQFSNTIFSKYLDLTPTEIRVADFIRNGKNTKEIAHFMGLSPVSVKWHRKNIREKLGLTNQKVNLHSYLSTLKK